MEYQETPLKSFFINQKLVIDEMIPQIKQEGIKSTTGVVIGKREQEKLNIYDMICTPDPEKTIPGLLPTLKKYIGEQQYDSQKSLPQLLATFYREFNYSDQFIDFVLQMERMLTQGIEVLGIFIYCNDVQEKQASFKKLNSLMNSMFVPEKEEEKDGRVCKQPHSQYILLSLYDKQIGQSLGDINVFTKNNLSNINEQLRNAPIIDKFLYAETKFQIQFSIPFTGKEKFVQDFRQLSQQIREEIKQKLNQGVVKIEKELYQLTNAQQINVDDILNSMKDDVNIDIQISDNKQQPKKGGKKGQKDQINLENYKIPTIKLSYLENVMQSKLSDQENYQHIFQLKGCLHLATYLSNDKATLKNIIENLQNDVDQQFEYRFEVMDEEVQSNAASVDPFNFNTENMVRVEPFNLLLPRRAQFQIIGGQKSVKTKLKFNDYQLFFEKQDEAMRRIYEQTGLLIKNKEFIYVEQLNNKECESKLLKFNQNTITKQEDKKHQNLNSTQQSPQKKEKSKEQIMKEKREQARLAEQKLKLWFFIISGICMVAMYLYVYNYLI